MARESILDRQYRTGRKYVEDNFPDLLGSKHSHWYAPLVEAYVAGAKRERRQMIRAQVQHSDAQT